MRLQTILVENPKVYSFIRNKTKQQLMSNYKLNWIFWGCSGLIGFFVKLNTNGLIGFLGFLVMAAIFEFVYHKLMNKLFKMPTFKLINNLQSLQNKDTQQSTLLKNSNLKPKFIRSHEK